TASAALPLQGLPWTFRRSHRHGAGRPSPAVARVGAVPLPDGVEPLEPADRRGAWFGHLGRAGDDRASAQSTLVARTPAVKLQGEVEIDEVYVVAGHKGQPAEVVKRGGRHGAAGCKAH